VTNMDYMFLNVEISVENYDNLLISWVQLNLQNNVEFYGGSSRYNIGTAANSRQQIIDDFGWSITDGGVNSIPITSFTTNTTTIPEGCWVKFTDSSTEGDIPFSYEWDFGDGSVNSTLINPVHQYTSIG